MKTPLSREQKITLLKVLKNGYFEPGDLKDLTIESGGLDLSKLTDTELEEYHRLLVKMKPNKE